MQTLRITTPFRLRSALRSSLALAALCVAVPSFAASGGYVGVRAGAVDGTRDTGDAGLSAELFGGYRFNNVWSIEVGAIGQNDDVASGHPEVEIRSEWSAFTVAARADMPLTARSRIHLRGGLAAVDAEMVQDVRYTRDDGVFVHRLDRFDGTSVGTVLAAGIDYALTDRWSAGFELQHLTGDLSLGCGEFECRFDRTGSVRVAALSLRADF